MRLGSRLLTATSPVHISSQLDGRFLQAVSEDVDMLLLD